MPVSRPPHSKVKISQDRITGTIVHPKATIFAAQGPIVIGSNCIIEEGAIILNRYVHNFPYTYPIDLTQTERGHANRGRQPLRDWQPYASLLSCTVEADFPVGVECPMGNFNTVCTRARVHFTTRLSSYCVIGAGCLVVATDEEILDEYTVIYGPKAERRVWSGRGRLQEADLRRKHAEYLREMLPKFNRLRRGDGS